MAHFKILALGDAVTDITFTTTRAHTIALLAQCESRAEADVEIGGCARVAGDVARAVARAVGADARVTSGGSAANVAKGLSALTRDAKSFTTRNQCAFVGAVDDDDVGEAYARAIRASGVDATLIVHATRDFEFDDERGSARCVCFVDEFGQRTMRTYLGASAKTQARDLPNEAFRDVDALHVEGYALYKPEVMKRACALAKRANANALISIDLASFEVVRYCRQALMEALTSGEIDVVFCNEDEARELVNGEFNGGDLNGRNAPRPSEAVENAAIDFLLRHVKVAAVSRGKRGCVARGSDGDVGVSAAEGVEALDTTGAGDTFTAAFLHAYLRGGTMQQCGDAGCAAGAEIVQVRGAEMSEERWARVREKLEAILG